MRLHLRCFLDLWCVFDSTGHRVICTAQISAVIAGIGKIAALGGLLDTIWGVEVCLTHGRFRFSVTHMIVWLEG